MKSLFIAILIILAVTAQLLAEPIPPGPVCPDECTEWYCNARGVCWCRPYPQSERCPVSIMAGNGTATIVNAADDEPSPDANPCVLECKAGCGGRAAEAYAYCLEQQFSGIDCSQIAADVLRSCKWECEQLGNTCPSPM